MYGYGIFVNLLCCFCFLVGVFIIFFVKRYKIVYNVVLLVFMGLVVGVLVSDVIFYLVFEVSSGLLLFVLLFF